jgi:RimJ/RimL family protein N-acetyltransferase
MKHLVTHQDERVARWVADHMPVFEFGSTPYTAIGQADRSGSLIAGCIYQNFTKTDLHMHVAALPGKRWMSKAYLGECFRYPFEQLGCRRVTGLVPGRNEVAARFDEHLGFVLEGRIRQVLANGDDLLVYGMLREECRFLKVGLNHGRKQYGTTDGWRRETSHVLPAGGNGLGDSRR